MKAFYNILVNSFLGSVTIMLVWFVLSLWVYTNTNSVLATSLMSGIYLIASTLTGIWFGSLVDHHKKKTMLAVSNLTTLAAFSIALAMFVILPDSAFTHHFNPELWLFVCCIFVGVIAGNIRNIALPTLVGILVPEENRDKANGLTGTAGGLSFFVSSVLGGISLAVSGMLGVLVGSILILILSLLHLWLITIPEKKIAAHLDENEGKKFDFLRTLALIRKTPGLFALILFTTFNNFLGGIFMPLMDPYGLSLVSLEVWGALWGFLSLGFILGGGFIAKKGLGKNPLQTLFRINFALWVISATFTIQPSIVLTSIGIFFYICLVPFIEASEHTIIQKIVPKERQGRVFGFAQSVETAASPLTALAIGPIAQFFFIPFMTTGAGVELIGSWYGTGIGRGIGLVFTTVGIIGLFVTFLAMNSRAYKTLSALYLKK